MEIKLEENINCIEKHLNRETKWYFDFGSDWFTKEDINRKYDEETQSFPNWWLWWDVTFWKS